MPEKEVNLTSGMSSLPVMSPPSRMSPVSFFAMVIDRHKQLSSSSR